MAGELWDETSDEPDEELLRSARDSAGLDERLAATTQHGFSLARRHPWVVAAVTVVVLGAASLTYYLTHRPPPVSPTVAATIELSGTEGNHYLVQLRTPGEEIHPVGVVGPGLASPTSTVPRVTADGPALGNLGATVDCGDQTWWEAGPDDYAVRVTRTDPYGRATTNDVAFSQSGDWWLRVRQQCLDNYLQATEPVTADVSETAVQKPGRGTVDVVVHLTNPGDRDLRVGTEGLRPQGAVRWEAVPARDLPSHGQLALRIPFLVDCRFGAPTLPPLATDGPLSGSILVSVTTTSDLAAAGWVLVGLELDAKSQGVVKAALSQACPS